MQPDGPPCAPAAFHKFTKNRKARKPTFRRPYTAAMPGRFPHASDPPYHYQAPKIRRQFRRDQRPAPQIPNQSNPNRSPGPALPVSANTRPIQPRHIQNLRYNPANQTPTNSSKSYIPARGGGGWHLLHAHTCTYARTAMGMHAHICTMVILARVCAHLYGYAHTYTGMRTLARPWSYTGGMSSLRSPGTMPAETSGRSPQIPNQSNPNKHPEPA